MPFTLFQGGSSLQIMKSNGDLTTLALPAGVTVDPNKRARFAVFRKYVVVVNSVTRPITVDADGVTRPLSLLPPGTPLALSGAAGGSLTGTYVAWQSFVLLDANREIVAESPLGPISTAAAIAAQYLKASGINLSTDTVTLSRLYRSTTLGTVAFPWIDVDGNTQTTAQDDVSDALMSLVAAPILGAAPELTLIGEYRERLWGVSVTDKDRVRWTEASKMYSWPSVNNLVVPREGADDRGITAILARRESLAIARQNSLVQIVGNSNNDFRVVKLSQEVGVEAPDSLAQFRDTIYFLWKDGIYTWGNDGINCISDGKTRAWFTTDTYFNRARFQYAVGRIDPTNNNKYQLLLSAAGSTALDRWVEYDLINHTWWGPHKTSDFTPTWIATLLDASNVSVPAIASSAGFWYREQDTRTDGTSTGIALDVDGKFHDDNTPDIEKQWLQPSILQKIQAAGTLDINAYLGGLNGPLQTTIKADMTKDRERLRHIGLGRYVKLNFKNDVAGQDAEIYGYEIPFFEVGRR